MIDPGLIDLIMRLRGSGISDNNLLGAMETISRKHFLPSDFWDLAYNEQSLPIGCGQDISSPLTIALLTQSLDLVSTHKVSRNWFWQWISYSNIISNGKTCLFNRAI